MQMKADRLFRALPLFLLASIGGCTNPAMVQTGAPLLPPYDYVAVGGPASKITFSNQSPQYEFYVTSFEDADACKRAHSLNRNVTDTISISASKKFTFLASFGATSYPKYWSCQGEFSFTPDGSDYVFLATQEAKICHFGLFKKTPGGLVETDLTERTFKHPFIDGWCKP